MECLSYKSELEDAVSHVRIFSYNEKKNIIDETAVNILLDKILELKNNLSKKTDKINDLINGLEKLTWFNDLNEECLMLINDLIAAIKDLHSSLIRQYINFNFLREKGIAKTEIKEFKNSIDDLKELYSDLESVFFFLPEMPEFSETTKQLSLI